MLSFETIFECRGGFFENLFARGKRPLRFCLTLHFEIILDLKHCTHITKGVP